MLKINKIEDKMGTGKGTLFYMFSALLIKVLGAFYKVPLFNLLSPYGVGLYQMIFPLFAFIITFCGGYITPLITKMIGQGKNSKKLFKKCLLIFLPLSFILSLLLFVFSGKISFLQGNVEGTKLYKVISFAIVPITLICFLRGYFQGKGNFVPTAVSQISEQIIKILVGLLCLSLIKGSYAEKAVYAVIALCLSEYLTFFYMAFIYYKDRKNYIKNKVNEEGKGEDISFKELFKNAMPLLFISLSLPLSSVVESFVVINALKNSYYQNATSVYGLYTGGVVTILMLPVGILHALSTGFLPKLSKETEGERYKKVLTITAVLSTLSTLLIFLFPGIIIKILFGKNNENFNLLKKLLKYSCPVVFLLSMVQCTNTILLSKGKQFYSAVSMGISVVLKVILNVILVKIPQINIFGMVISDLACYFVALIANLLYIYKSNKNRAGLINENHTCRIGNWFRHRYPWRI